MASAAMATITKSKIAESTRLTPACRFLLSILSPLLALLGKVLHVGVGRKLRQSLVIGAGRHQGRNFVEPPLVWISQGHVCQCQRCATAYGCKPPVYDQREIPRASRARGECPALKSGRTR